MEKFFELDYSDFSDVGQKRDHNEDYASFYIPQDAEERVNSGSLFVVADGVGGAAKGEVASKYAVETVLFEYFRNKQLPPPERLAAAFQKANSDIHHYSHENGNFTRMATTMVAAAVIQNKLIIANVGDSRAYLIRGGQIKQISRDHSVVEEMVRDGLMTPEEARTSKIKNRLSRSIGGEPSVAVDVYPPIPLQKGDRILLCSDGLTRYAESDTLLRLSSVKSVLDATKQMIRFANKRGGVDNITAVLIETVDKSRTKKKAPSRRETRPSLPEWQAADTQYPSPQAAAAKKSNRLLLAIGLIVAVVAISGITALLLNPGILQLDPTPGTTPSLAVFVEPAEETIVPPTATPSVEKTIEEEDADPLAENEANPPEKTETIKVIIDNTNIEWRCIYFVQEGDGIGLIFKNFPEAPQYDPNIQMDYFKYKNCIIDEKNPNTALNCSQLGTISNVELITTSEQIVIFDSTTDIANAIDFCTKNGGKIFYLEE